MSKRSKVHINEILKKHGALFNYIKDQYGFRVGIVVMMKGENRDTPKVGWALFNETHERQFGNDVKTLGGLPVAQELLEDILVKTCEVFNEHKTADEPTSPYMLDIYNDVETLKKLRIGSPECRSFFQSNALTSKGKADILTLAIRRANTDRDNYFAYTPESPSIPNLRYDQSEIDWEYGEIPIQRPCEAFLLRSPMLAQSIKRAVREAEYRAWRYFK